METGLLLTLHNRPELPLRDGHPARSGLTMITTETSICSSAGSGTSTSQSINTVLLRTFQGSTGRPKGIGVPHRAVARLVLGTSYIDLGPGDRVAQASNATFDAATFEIWGALLTGGTVVGLGREQTLSPEGLKLTEKGKRLGKELTWKDIVGGDAALSSALSASLGS